MLSLRASQKTEETKPARAGRPNKKAESHQPPNWRLK